MSNLIKLLEKEDLNKGFPTKKDITEYANIFADKIIDSGYHNPEEIYSQSKRLKTALDILEKRFKKSLPDENFESFGMRGEFRQGGDDPQYNDDEVYKHLEKDLKDRKELLKTALKSDKTIFDAYGNEVTKVSTKPRKSFLAVKF